MTTKGQVDLSAITKDPRLVALLRQLVTTPPPESAPKRRGAKPRSLAERFGASLRGTVSPGVGRTYDAMMAQVEPQLTEYVREHGMTPQLYAALIKVYFSREGREARRG